LGYTALAVSDVFLVKSLVTGIGKAVLTAGFKSGTVKFFGIGMSHNYGATISRLRGLGLEMSGFKHHWAISQKLMEKNSILKAIGNQAWNLTEFSSQASHMRWAHGQLYQGVSYPFTTLLYPITSTPTWFKAGAFSYGGRLIN
jgi:hypothetical protein